LQHPFIQKLELNLDIVTFSKEQEYIGTIIDTFHDIKCYKQFTVGTYRVDLYFPEHRLAIECDEHNHADRDKEYELKRQTYIENELKKCSFYRFNPDDTKFNMYRIIRKITSFIENKELEKIQKQNEEKIKKMEKKIEGMEEKIYNLELENKFRDPKPTHWQTHQLNKLSKFSNSSNL
jgi:very-short-patch-repair endonuclease